MQYMYTHYQDPNNFFNILFESTKWLIFFEVWARGFVLPRAARHARESWLEGLQTDSGWDLGQHFALRNNETENDKIKVKFLALLFIFPGRLKSKKS